MKDLSLHRRLFFIIYSLFISGAAAQTAAQTRCHYAPSDSTTVEWLLALDVPTELEGCEMLFYARQLLGRPYVAHTLELYPDDERLVLNTRELDCTTLVDVVVALTRCKQAGQTRFGQFTEQLQRQRYWNGVCTDYTSRIHYFSDWIRDNTRLGMVTEVQTPTPPFSAVQTVSVSYMTRHPQQYTALARHPELLPIISRQEADLTGRQYRYIPTAEVTDSELMRRTVLDGDIICIVTDAEGLDIAHLGIAVWHDDGLHMIDASSLQKKVVEEHLTMRQYLERHSHDIGIRVVRVR